MLILFTSIKNYEIKRHLIFMKVALFIMEDFKLLLIGKYMLDNRSANILLVIILLFIPQTLFAQPQIKFACMSSWYEHCNMGICEDSFNKEPFLRKVKIIIDLRSKTLIRRTDNDYIMQITETRLRPENHIYISYEDNWCNGFIVISLLNEEVGTSSYMDTLFTNTGGFVSTGFCKLQILE